MDPRLGTALLVLVGVPAVIVGYIYATEWILRLVPDRRRSVVRPWLWLLPALLFLFVFLVWPTILTIARSFQGTAAGTFVGLDNYVWFFTSSEAIVSLRNAAMWVVLLTVFTVFGRPDLGFGAVAAWTAACLLLHLLQLLQGMRAARGGKLTSWMA